MALAFIEYILARKISLETIERNLNRHGTWRAYPPVQFERTYYDTFDWRLYLNNYLLFVETYADSTRRLILQRQQCSDVKLDVAADFQPGFNWDLPDETIQRRLRTILAMRKLLPQASINISRHAWSLLNKDQKTLLRVFVDQNSAPAISGEDNIMLTRISIVPLKGYAKPLAQVRQTIERELQLEACDKNSELMAAALATGQRKPGDYSSKLKLALQPTMTAESALKHILDHLLNAMRVNEQGLIDNLDSEFLHDFRVAVRRTRSALNQFKKVAPARERFETDFVWLGQITSPVRDLDVYLLNFDGYRASLPETMRPALAPLHELLRQQHRIEHRLLCKRLRGKRYKTLIADWRRRLRSPWPKDDHCPDAARAIKPLVDERIWRVYRRVLKQGHAIHPGSPAEALHDLRKTCKKLRYLIEFFQSLYPEKKIKQPIAQLKNLQQNLGDFQDFEVQAGTLKQFAEQLNASAATPSDTLLAMGMLIARLEQRQHHARAQFANRFAQFESKKNQARFKALFDHQYNRDSYASSCDI